MINVPKTLHLKLQTGSRVIAVIAEKITLLTFLLELLLLLLFKEPKTKL